MNRPPPSALPKWRFCSASFGNLNRTGVAIIYISHKLEELLQIGDHITILRDGRKVAEEEAKNVNVPWMIEKMVGRNPAALFTHKERPLGDVLLKVENLTLPRARWRLPARSCFF